MSDVCSRLAGLVGAHALMVERPAERAAFLAALIRSPLADHWWIVPADGGLLADYGLRQNLLLPAQVRGDGTAAERLSRWQQRLALAGVAALPLYLPLNTLNPWQLRLAGFLRALVADAPALVFDDTCYGLQAEEQRQAALLHAFYHRYFPFRPSLYLSLSEPPSELNISSRNFQRHEASRVSQN
jgi:hypothetical protein